MHCGLEAVAKMLRACGESRVHVPELVLKKHVGILPGGKKGGGPVKGTSSRTDRKCCMAGRHLAWLKLRSREAQSDRLKEY